MRASQIPGRSQNDYHKQKKRMFLYNADGGHKLLKGDKYELRHDIKAGSSENLLRNMGLEKHSISKKSLRAESRGKEDELR